MFFKFPAGIIIGRRSGVFPFTDFPRPWANSRFDHFYGKSLLLFLVFDFNQNVSSLSFVETTFEAVQKGLFKPLSVTEKSSAAMNLCELFFNLHSRGRIYHVLGNAGYFVDFLNRVEPKSSLFEITCAYFKPIDSVIYLQVHGLGLQLYVFNFHIDLVFLTRNITNFDTSFFQGLHGFDEILQNILKHFLEGIYLRLFYGQRRTWNNS